MRRNKWSLALAAGVAASLLTACGGDSEAADVETNEAGELVVDGEVIADKELYAAAKDEGSFMLYTGGGEESERALLDQFEKDTGIEGEMLRLVPNKLTERILSEQAVDKLGADAIRISDAQMVKAVADSGAFDTHELLDTSCAPADAVQQDGAYVRVWERVYAIGYNNQLVDEGDAPAAWEDLVDPAWKGKAGIVQVGAGGSTASLTRFQISQFGEEHLRSFAALEPRIFDSASTAIDAAARGEIEVAPMTVGNAAGAIAEGAPITLVFPEEGMPSYEFFMGVAAGADHEAAARVFLNWTLSQRGQEATAQQGDYPACEGVEAPSIGDIELPSREEANLVRYEQADALKNTAPDAELWQDIFSYTAPEE
ncbi:ABC transporter substrate-binding protein [Nocardioides sp. cx-173]|uniref:ABC transporter substrate-binding protein n=1 Tax=Nocardioides sp. cx-173 TaxID=2898796 RepID=UPI001E4BC297|nr:extracellular solute-binding protein [Nocardioides sp. cx-173]MCD4525264.1 extracellular solute-binding protein [Nocardioides sp. cx-173]UGB40934.1 extracellular solute-binding protein [Nocardioides sp. cx-173]